MGRMTTEVMTHDVSLLWQNIFTWLSWAVALAMIVVAIQMGRRHRTPFYLIACVAAGVAAYAEPLYDVAFDLWFYDAHNGQPGAGLMHFSAFGIAQPNWTHSGYIILYAGACLYAGKRIYDGRFNRKGLFALWGLEVLTSCVFEVIGTGTDVYTYYGPHVLRIWNYPIVIGILEGTQVVLFTVVAVLIWRKTSRWWELMSLFVVFPMTFFGANFGLGYPLIIAMHLDNGLASPALVFAATLVSIILCTIVIYGLTVFLPAAPAAAAAPTNRPGRPAQAQLAG
ncbi:Uncharacterised protein [Mycolicibacterium fortuitum]|jgi:hypothetical protein|uniref:Uncharacterized protein n=1 Tax=Mycolicibacterium fortuitum TaxID=1766 RepID=A0A378U5H5_MYCFO|nr:Uncharacterised protein [Mycolicibacterium fortuitum]